MEFVIPNEHGDGRNFHRTFACQYVFYIFKYEERKDFLLL